MRGWRRRKFTGGITVIITIIAGTGGIIAITIIIITTATGTAGKCGSLAQHLNRPASSRACLISAVALKPARLPTDIPEISIRKRSRS